MTTKDVEIDEVEQEPLEDKVEIEGIDEPAAGGLDWGDKTRQLMRQIVTQKVELPISRLRQMIDDKEIDLAPGFQRRLRWTRAQKSRLIESVIMNVPIPPVFLGESKPGQYVVLDGRQRLTALYEFLGDNFRLSGLTVWSELNGKKFKSLKGMGDPPVASAITRRFVPAILILHETVPEVKYEVFDRLNTGGVIAEPMEVRNAIYYGPFNDLLHSLSKDQDFLALWGIPADSKQRERNASFRKMVDLEMALRFFAFQRHKDFAGSLKTFLNEFMAKRNAEYRADPSLAASDNELFRRTMSRTRSLLGDQAFHRIDASGSRSRFPSAPLADAILYAVSKATDAEFGAFNGAKVRQTIDDLIRTDEEFAKAISSGTNARVSTEYRIEKLTRTMLGLAPSQPVPY